MVEAVCASHIGKRPNHEDNFLFNGRYIDADTQAGMPDKKFILFTSDSHANVRFFAVSDGMGGHNAGEVASRICVEKLLMLEQTVRGSTGIRDIVERTESAIAGINETVCEMGRNDAALKGMGATLVIFITCGSDYAVLNIGDSRAYHFDGNKLIRLTRDHTEGQRLLDLGLLSREELKDFPARKNLNRYIGYGANGLILRADEYYPHMESGVVMLASDGITDFITETQIASILSSKKDIAEAAHTLLERAVASDNSDNATVMLIPVGR